MSGPISSRTLLANLFSLFAIMQWAFFRLGYSSQRVWDVHSKAHAPIQEVEPYQKCMKLHCFRFVRQGEAPRILVYCRGYLNFLTHYRLKLYPHVLSLLTRFTSKRGLSHEKTP